MNEAILLADERMAFVTGDEEAIDAYERRQKALCDMTSFRNYVLEEGHREGKAERTLEIALKMKNAGRPLTEIGEFTGLSLEEIEKLSASP